MAPVASGIDHKFVDTAVCGRSASEMFFIPAIVQYCIKMYVHSPPLQVSDNIGENPLYDWLVDDTLFELLGSLITNPCLKRRFGVGACRLLGLISQCRWKEVF